MDKNLAIGTKGRLDITIDSKKNADYEPSESEDRDRQIHILISHI